MEKKTSNSFKVEIQPRIIYLVLFLIGLGLLAWEIRSVLVMFFVAFILNAGLRPLVNWLCSYRIPRPLSILIIYGVLLAITITAVLLVVSELANQLGDLVRNLPGIYQNLRQFLESSFPSIANILPLNIIGTEVDSFASSLLQNENVRNLLTGENVVNVAAEAYRAIGSVGTLILSGFTVMMVSIYMLQKESEVYEGILTLLPDRWTARLRVMLEKIQTSLGSWLIGQIILMLAIGLLTYVVVMVPGWLNVSGYRLHEFALPIAILAGFLEALPNIGPFLTGIIAGLLAIGTSGLGGLLYVVFSFFMIQNVEAIFIVPQVMRKAVDVDPILTILGIIAGFEFGGVVGAILIVPLIAIVQIVILEWAQQEAQNQG